MSSLKVLEIWISKESKKESINSCEFIKDFGIKGDLKGGKKGSEVIIFLNAPLSPGFCTKRFKPNLVVENLNIETLKVNDFIYIDDIILKVSKIGKHCFPECTLTKENIPCPLKTNVIFTSVFKGGFLKI